MNERQYRRLASVFISGKRGSIYTCQSLKDAILNEWGIDVPLAIIRDILHDMIEWGEVTSLYRDEYSPSYFIEYYRVRYRDNDA